MIGPQRDILAHLGIERWVPRHIHVQKAQPSNRWRDSSEFEHLQQLNVEPVLALEPTPQITVASAARTTPQKMPSVKPDLAEQAVVMPNAEPIAFHLQALVSTHWVILIEASQLSVEQQQLWQNIQQALQADYHQLQWPFMGFAWQDPRGVPSYIQGFLNRFIDEHRILSLGVIQVLPQVQEQMPDLQAMLEQPLLKQKLWQKIQQNE